jgi:MarR family transcriptional regulator, organic hydroperoxide resistance regulator
MEPAPITLKRKLVLSRENLGFLLAKASQRWNELLSARFREAGFPDVSPAFGSILLPLFEEDGLRITELGRRAGLSKQTMTTMIRIMEERRLVERRPDMQDRRAARIFLTSRSRAFEKDAARLLGSMEALVNARIDPDQVETTREVLKKLAQLGAP